MTNDAWPDADLSFERDGAARFARDAVPLLAGIESALAQIPEERAGARLHGVSGLAELLVGGPIQGIAARSIGAGAKPVRAILFDKRADMNWALGWHQDRTIAVAARVAVSGFGPWTVKQGMVHVAPPFALLAGMATLRVHLDPVDADNAPLLIAPGSHRAQVAERDVDAVVAASEVRACLAARGDVWAYATPILHASEAARRPARRRVLQVDYAAVELPGGLRWLGI